MPPRWIALALVVGCASQAPGAELGAWEHQADQPTVSEPGAFDAGATPPSAQPPPNAVPDAGPPVPDAGLGVDLDRCMHAECDAGPVPAVVPPVELDDAGVPEPDCCEPGLCCRDCEYLPASRLCAVRFDADAATCLGASAIDGPAEITRCSGESSTCDGETELDDSFRVTCAGWQTCIVSSDPVYLLPETDTFDRSAVCVE